MDAGAVDVPPVGWQFAVRQTERRIAALTKVVLFYRAAARHEHSEEKSRHHGGQGGERRGAARGSLARVRTRARTHGSASAVPRGNQNRFERFTHLPETRIPETRGTARRGDIISDVVSATKLTRKGFCDNCDSVVVSMPSSRRRTSSCVH